MYAYTGYATSRNSGRKGLQRSGISLKPPHACLSISSVPLQRKARDSPPHPPCPLFRRATEGLGSSRAVRLAEAAPGHREVEAETSSAGEAPRRWARPAPTPSAASAHSDTPHLVCAFRPAAQGEAGAAATGAGPRAPRGAEFAQQPRALEQKAAPLASRDMASSACPSALLCRGALHSFCCCRRQRER